MKLSYYPGCTLKNKAKDLDIYARLSLEKLGYPLEEITDWQCCGGTFVSDKDDIARKLSAVRTLKQAKERNTPLITVCSACHHVLKRTNYTMQTDENFAYRANLYLGGEEYHGETVIYHYLEFLRDVVGWENVKKAVVNPPTDKKVGAYYGCMLLRPQKEMAMDDSENPQILEDFLRAIGATPVIFAKRVECCGSCTAVVEAPKYDDLAKGIVENAKEQGAEMLVTACPSCKYILDKNGRELPVIYFTELLAEALGVKA